MGSLASAEPFAFRRSCTARRVCPAPSTPDVVALDWPPWGRAPRACRAWSARPLARGKGRRGRYVLCVKMAMGGARAWAPAPRPAPVPRPRGQ
eukprot:7003334-Pyramimonas_sp.AAC.1